MPPNATAYWKCNTAVVSACPSSAYREFKQPEPQRTQRCLQCAHAYFNSTLRAAGCTKELVQAACSPPNASECYYGIKDSKCGATAANCTACTALKKHPASCEACTQCEDCAFSSPATAKANCTFPLALTACGDNVMRPQRHWNIVEDYSPFESPPAMMNNCTCFLKNGSYDCPTIADHGNHAEPRAGCSFDMLAGAMWFQRQKQYLLANGVAVMTANTRIFDGWNIDMPSWKTGEDPPFFARLAQEMKQGAHGSLNPARVGFHGWSGGAQMVSNLANVWAMGLLPGLEMKAGVMMSGGSHQCYNLPPISQAQCADCDPSPQCMTPGCSASAKSRTGSKPCCYMCCPQGLTETYFQEHADEYARHPAMFLGQVSTDDVQADGCAAQYYHDAMQQHNATSELHLVPLSEQRCHAIGQTQDPAADKAAGGRDKWARYCDTNYNLNSMNHTTGAAAMVEPLARFLVKHL